MWLASLHTFRYSLASFLYANGCAQPISANNLLTKIGEMLMKLPFFILSVFYCLSPASFADEAQLASQIQRLTGIMLEQEQLLQQHGQELRQLRGDNELIRHQLRSLEERQNDLYTDIDQRLGNMQAPVIVDSPVIIAPPVEPVSDDNSDNDKAATVSGEFKQPADIAVKNTILAPIGTPEKPKVITHDLMKEGNMSAQQAYKAAFELIKMRQYPQAVLAFHMFLKQYGNTDYADNAQYWLGEAYYAQRDYKQAIAIFNELMDTYPNSPKRAHALLKAAFAYDSLNDKITAQGLLQQLRRDYPNTATARLALERLQRLQTEKP